MQDLFIDKPGYIEITTTVDSKETALKISGELVRQKLAACVQIIENITSVYMWKEKRETTSECLLLIKTKMDVFGRLAEELKKIHPYEIPEIIAKQIIDGSTQYLNWIEENTER